MANDVAHLPIKIKNTLCFLFFTVTTKTLFKT